MVLVRKIESTDIKSVLFLYIFYYFLLEQPFKNRTISENEKMSLFGKIYEYNVNVKKNHKNFPLFLCFGNNK